MDKSQVRSCISGSGSITYDPTTGVIGGGGGGTGTVTTVSVVTNDGVSGTVANATTTPAITLDLGTITPDAVSILGTSGNGYLKLRSQTLTVPTPSSGVTVWADNLNRFGWVNPSAYAVSLDDTGITASRNYTLPNSSGTLALLSDITSGYVPYTGATNDVDLDTHILNAKALHVKGTGGNGHLGLKHQSSDATAGGGETALYADVNGDIKYKNDGNYRTTLKTSLNTADRVYTFKDASGTLAFTSDLPTPAALTKTNDTNVTLTLGGTPATALLQAASITVGWSGQLAITRGGTGLGTLGTANQLIRVNAGATALEYFTPTYGSGTVTSIATAGLISGGTITSSGTITTSVTTNKLVGRATAGTGVMEEITLGTGLSFTGTTLNATGGGLTVGTTAIASGTAGRILFEGAGNVLQENAILNLDTTNGIIIGGTTARATRLTAINAANTAGSKTLVVRNAADSADIFTLTGDGKAKFVSEASSRAEIYSSSGGVLDLYDAFGRNIQITATNGAHGVFVVSGGMSAVGSSTVGIRMRSTGAAAYILECTNSFSQKPLDCQMDTSGVTGTYKFQTFTASSTNYVQFNGGNGSNSGFSATPALAISSNRNVGINNGTYGTSAVGVLAVGTGTAPSGGRPADAFQLYSADIVAGNAAPHFQTENGGIIKIYQETTAVAAATLISNLGVPLTSTDTIGGYTLLQVVKALQLQGLLA